MHEPYEHKGVTYSETLPRIVLVSPFVSDRQLVDRGHNVKQCVAQYSRSASIGQIDSPAPPYEIDVLIVHDAMRTSSNGVIKWPSGYTEAFSRFVRQ